VEQIIKKTTRLLAEGNRSRASELERAQCKPKAEQEIANIMTAIKAGILTASTKLELEKAEADRATLQQAIQASTANTNKVATLLPRPKERFGAVVRDLGRTLGKKPVAQARDQVRNLVGEIRLVPMTDGYLEAVFTGGYEGLLKLAVGGKLNNVVAGEGFNHYLTPSIHIALK
jgi:hypothetical protein